MRFVYIVIVILNIKLIYLIMNLLKWQTNLEALTKVLILNLFIVEVVMKQKLPDLIIDEKSNVKVNN